ncbi:hypothetical protein HYG86_13885 [Alkalicella caledoniensis]|uniref:Uncharacterized protein n=1 Tax=Alkalicella caledoniensis TaxID=2731377 RepID=A0A7G9WAR3_ALKCA|nr:hypothetical protein [Alkalicella caledoniensis]QNO15775.1 hypothetical protein HYG86_13885 [Alkalicella caledoniensis]
MGRLRGSHKAKALATMDWRWVDFCHRNSCCSPWLTMGGPAWDAYGGRTRLKPWLQWAGDGWIFSTEIAVVAHGLPWVDLLG